MARVDHTLSTLYPLMDTWVVPAFPPLSIAARSRARTSAYDPPSALGPAKPDLGVPLGDEGLRRRVNCLNEGDRGLHHTGTEERIYRN